MSGSVTVVCGMVLRRGERGRRETALTCRASLFAWSYALCRTLLNSEAVIPCRDAQVGALWPSCPQRAQAREGWAPSW